MSRISRAGLCLALASLLALNAGAQEAPKPPAPPVAQPAAPDAEQQASASNRIRVIGMIPPPNVGEGAPYHSPEEIQAIASEAGRDASDASVETRVAGRSSDCKDSTPDMYTPIGADPLARVASHTPRLQGLYRTEKSQATQVSQLAAKALAATNKAEDSRRDAAAGANNKREVEKTELDRQKAVNALEKARFKLMETQAQIADYGFIRMRNGGEEITWLDLDMKALQRKRAGWGLGVPKPSDSGLAVANMQAGEFEDERGFYLRISGIIVNQGEKAVRIPEFIVSILDQRGLPLRNVMGAPRVSEPLKPGGALPFTFAMRPSPQNMGRVVVNFASGREPPPETPVNLLCSASPPPD